MKKNERKKINWKRTFKNNSYMLYLIARSCPGVLVLACLDVVVSAAGRFLLGTYLYQYALNALLEGKKLKEVLITIAAMLSFAVFQEIVSVVYRSYRHLKRHKIKADIQLMIQEKAGSVDIACYENPDFYDTYVKATKDAGKLPFKVLDTLEGAVWLMLYIGISAVWIATIEPIFIPIALIPLLYRMFMGGRQNRLRYHYNMEMEEAGRKRDYVQRTFYLNDFSKEMRLTQMWTVMFRRMRNSVAEMKEIVSRYGFRLMLLKHSFSVISEIVVYMGTMVLAGHRTLVSRTMLPGDCFVVLNCISNIAENVGHMADLFMRLDENSLYIENLHDFLNYEIRIAEKTDAQPAPEMQTLQLCNVSFGYGNASEPVLKNVNMTIQRGEKIAVVGHNGAGKTTLIKLLQRLYDPTEGSVLLNGEDIRNFQLSTYREKFGTVFQDYGLFAVSVAENVMLRGNVTDADRETVKEALQKSGMYEKVMSLSKGVDTVVTKEFDNEGAVFSGGEAQKISIARVFAGHHEIVIMDEPTSALDPIAEQEMYRNMFAACEGKTVIFISHRLSSAAMTDRIYLFENGEIAEQGTHRELMKRNAKYADMWHKQADIYTGEEA